MIRYEVVQYKGRRHNNHVAGTDGSIWTYYRGDKSRGTKPRWKRRKPVPLPGGYLRVVLSEGGARISVLVHLVILETFTGPSPKGMTARHFPDRTRSNNQLSNLSYSTRIVNMYDKEFHGTMWRGGGGPRKLNPRRVRNLRRLRQRGWSYVRLGRRFDLTTTGARKAALGITWSNVS